MSFFQDIFGNAKKILKDQLGSEITYERGKGITSDTGRKPKVLDTFISNRGFSNEEVSKAKLNPKDSAIGIAKTAGEIVQGGYNLTHMLGNTIADKVLPGFDAEAAKQSRNKLSEKVSPFLAPANASQAKLMKGADIAGFIPGLSVSKASKADKLFDLMNKSKTGIITNTSRKLGNKRIYQSSINELVGEDLVDLDPVRVKKYLNDINRGKKLDPIKVDASTGQPIVKEGRHKLAAMREAGVDFADVVDASPVPKPKVTPKPRQNGDAFDIKKFNAEDVVKQRVKDRNAARGSKTLKDKSVEFLENFENKIIDFTSPIQRRFDKAIKNDPNFKASQKFETNIKDNIDRVLNTPAITSNFVKKNGLEDVIKGVDNLDEFDQYVSAKHILDLSDDVVKKSKFNLAEEKAIVAAFDGKYADHAKKLNAYNDKALDYMVDSGIISKNLKDGLKKKYPNYVPLQRVFSEDELGKALHGGNGVASISQQSVIQKIAGSERKIESPMESVMQNAEAMIRQGEKNKAAKAITSYADIKGNPFELRKLKAGEKAAADKGTISVLVDGKKEIWEVASDVADAAKALNVQQLNILGKILSMPVRLARLGITGVNLPFVMANVARDQVSSFIMSDAGLRSSIANPRVWLAGLGDSIKHGKLHDDMIGEGALMTSFDITRNKVGPTVKKIRAGKDFKSKVKYTATNPQEWLRMVEDVVGRSEEVARKQQFLGNKQKAILDGATEVQAKNIAARAARENSTNFARRGEWGTVMNNTWLYLNAGIQGSRLLVRNLKNKPVATTAKIATTLMMPMATITYWNLKDPERKAAYDDIQEYEKENNFIIVPPNPVKDEDGRWNVIKIPLPPGVGQFANFVRRPIEASQGLDKVQFGEAANNLVRTFTPVDISKPANTITPQAMKPIIQAATGQNLFTGNDTVPKSLQDLPNEQQVKDNTSGTAELVGNALGASPIKTEQAVKDTLGGIGPQILNASDRLLNKAGVLNDDQIGGQSIPEGVSRRFNSAAGDKTEGEQMTEIYDLKKESRGATAEQKKLAEEMLTAFKEMPKEEANAQMRELKKTDEALYNKIVSIKQSDDLGLSGPERAMKSLRVTDGTRAQYIYDQAKVMSKEEANAYISDLRTKKVISDKVLKQIKKLKSNDTI